MLQIMAMVKRRPQREQPNSGGGAGFVWAGGGGGAAGVNCIPSSPALDLTAFASEGNGATTTPSEMTVVRVDPPRLPEKAEEWSAAFPVPLPPKGRWWTWPVVGAGVAFAASATLFWADFGGLGTVESLMSGGIVSLGLALVVAVVAGDLQFGRRKAREDETSRVQTARRRAGRLLIAMKRHSTLLSDWIGAGDRPCVLVRGELAVAFEKEGGKIGAAVVFLGGGGREPLVSAVLAADGSGREGPRASKITGKLLDEHEIQGLFDIAADALDDFVRGRAVPGGFPDATGFLRGTAERTPSPQDRGPPSGARARTPPLGEQGAVGAAMVSLSAFAFRLAEAESSSSHRTPARSAIRRLRGAADEMLDALCCDGADSARAAALADHLLPLSRSAVEDFILVGGAGTGDPALRAAVDRVERSLCDAAELFEEHARSLRLHSLESLSERLEIGLAVSRIADPAVRLS